MTRVLIAAPTPMLRAGLRALLAAPNIEITGDSAALVQLESDLAGVDVLLVADAALLAHATRVIPDDGRLAIVALADNDSPAATLRALPLRGWGIVAPDATSDELCAAIIAAAQGLVVLPLALAARIVVPRAPQSISEAPAESLTAREREVLALVSQGLPNKLIARELHISEHTVKFHISSIYAKLGVASRTEAVNRGARYGLITL